MSTDEDKICKRDATAYGIAWALAQNGPAGKKRAGKEQHAAVEREMDDEVVSGNASF